MLLELHIKDFAIIKDLSLSFSSGFNCLTGETGAGKSIIIDAVKLLLGDRATLDMIRTGEDEAEIEGLFDISSNSLVQDVLLKKGFDKDDTLLIRRIISRGERNKVYINGQLATLSILNTLGRQLVDIYGQHEHQTLLRPWMHIDLLDNYGELWGLREEMARVFNELAVIEKEVEELKRKKDERIQREELLLYQIREIEKAELKEGEEEELKKERERLLHSELLLTATRDGCERIYARDNSILEELGKVITQLEKASSYDEALSPSVKTLQDVVYELEDVSARLRDYYNKLEVNPERLEEIEERLALISSLKKKYGDTVSKVIIYGRKAREELQVFEENSERIKKLEESREVLRADALKIAEELSRKRSELSKSLKEDVAKELSSLGMGKTAFEVSINPIEMGEKGIDQVEFLLSPNPGEALKPLSKIASGGELSRIMLALKIISRSSGVPSLIFDEVDAGIGGRIADSVGRRLKSLSCKHQIFCVTHLPQIASYADHHYRVLKREMEGRTVTSVDKLNAQERIEELSRMLGGKRITEKTMEHAREMLLKIED